MLQEDLVNGKLILLMLGIYLLMILKSIIYVRVYGMMYHNHYKPFHCFTGYLENFSHCSCTSKTILMEICFKDLKILSMFRKIFNEAYFCKVHGYGFSV